MGKTYIDTVKYMVRAQIETDGIVEKPDVVGALFGQTEGLLGEELDLRELQKSGRIGRIEVNVKDVNGKSVGEITLPSSLDRVETAILAAALETVDRVGPCEAKVKILGIEDTRTNKRDLVVNRAQDILKMMIQDKAPESKEISGKVRDEVKTAEVGEFGPEKLACGPDIFEGEEIIIVEGRADVITLLKADIKNAVAIQGKNIPASVAELTKQKSVTAFVDGDRGGDLILKQMEGSCEIDFVTKAPDGKEVEELTKKEILKCLKHVIPYQQFMNRMSYNQEQKPAYQKKEYRPDTRRNYSENNRYSDNRGRPDYNKDDSPRGRDSYKREDRPRRDYDRRDSPRSPPRGRDSYRRDDRPRRDYNRVAPKPIENPYKDVLSNLKGSLKGVLLDESKTPIVETDVRNISKEIEGNDKIAAVVFDGIITQRLVDAANKKKVEYLIGVKQTKIDNKGGVKVITES